MRKVGPYFLLDYQFKECLTFSWAEQKGKCRIQPHCNFSVDDLYTKTANVNKWWECNERFSFKICKLFNYWCKQTTDDKTTEFPHILEKSWLKKCDDDDDDDDYDADNGDDDDAMMMMMMMPWWGCWHHDEDDDDAMMRMMMMMTSWW